MIPLVTSNPLGRLSIAQLVKALFISAITPAATALVNRVSSAFSATDELRGRESNSSIDLRRLQVDDRATYVVIHAELILSSGFQVVEMGSGAKDIMIARFNGTHTEVQFLNSRTLEQIGPPVFLDGRVISAVCGRQVVQYAQNNTFTYDQSVVFTQQDESWLRYELDSNRGDKVSAYNFSNPGPTDVKREDVGTLAAGACDTTEDSTVVYKNTIPRYGIIVSSLLFPTKTDENGDIEEERLVKSKEEPSEPINYCIGSRIYTTYINGDFRIFAIPPKEQNQPFSDESIYDDSSVFFGKEVECYRHVFASLHPDSLNGRRIDVYNFKSLKPDQSISDIAQSFILKDVTVVDHRVIPTDDINHQYLLLQIEDNDGQRKAVFVSIEEGNTQPQLASYFDLGLYENLIGDHMSSLFLYLEAGQKKITSITVDPSKLPRFAEFDALAPTRYPTYVPTTRQPSSEPTTSRSSFIPTTLAPSSRSTTMAPAIAPTTIAHPSRTTTSMPSVTPTAESPTLSQILKDMITGQPSVAPLSDIPTVLTIIADTPTLQPIMDALVADGSSNKSRSLLTELPLPYMLIVMTAASICLILLCIKLVFVWNRDRDNQIGSIFSYLPPKQNNIPNPDTPEVPERLL